MGIALYTVFWDTSLLGDEDTAKQIHNDKKWDAVPDSIKTAFAKFNDGIETVRNSVYN